MTDAAATLTLRPSERFDVGGVLARTFTTIGRNLPVFALLAVLGVVVPQIISSGLNFVFEPQLLGSNAVASIAAHGYPPNYGWIIFVSTLITCVGLLYLLITVCGIVISRERGTASPNLVSDPWRHMLPLVGIFVIALAAIMVGYILLIVPGIIVTLALCVVAPARVGEGLGVAGSLDRSRVLTRGFRWRIFLVLLVMFLINGSLELIAVLALRFLSQNPISGVVIFAPLYAAVCVINFTTYAEIYCELLKAKEGAPASEVAAAFS